MDTFDKIKATKGDKHLVIIEALIDADLAFIEDSESIYKLFGHRFDIAVFFSRTFTLQTKKDKQTNTIKFNSFAEMVEYLKKG